MNANALLLTLFGLGQSLSSSYTDYGGRSSDAGTEEGSSDPASAYPDDDGIGSPASGNAANGSQDTGLGDAIDGAAEELADEVVEAAEKAEGEVQDMLSGIFGSWGLGGLADGSSNPESERDSNG